MRLAHTVLLLSFGCRVSVDTGDDVDTDADTDTDTDSDTDTDTDSDSDADTDADTDTDTDTDSDTDTDTDTDSDTDSDADTDTGTIDTDPPGPLTADVLVTGLGAPFEVLVGPDDKLWVTERSLGKVTLVSTVDGSLSTVLTLSDMTYTSGSQDGLMGMAFDPAFSSTTGSVYLAYTYGVDADERVKIVRYLWDGVALSSPTTLVSGLPGSPDHNSGRLLYGPDDRLYYTIGDQGNNQLSRFCVQNHAQDLPTAAEIAASDWTDYEGKVLRIALDGGIPTDNPTLDGVQSHIYTYGHRNPQGLAFGADGTLYEAEHGPKTDDEVNLLEAGMNYGWPNVVGYQDDSAYVYGDWSASTDGCETLSYDEFAIPSSVPQMNESDWSDPDFREPARTFYTVADTYEFKDADCADSGIYFVCWPTIAPSSIAVYDGFSDGAVVDGSLLITSLKLGNLYRVDLVDSVGDALGGTGEPEILYHSTDRFRRVTVSADGTALYVATDVSGPAMGADGHPTSTLDNLGSILVLHE